MKILYITRKYPPSIGGMETHSYEFCRALKKRAVMHIIAWGHSQAFLPIFVLFALIKGLIVLLSKQIDIIQVGGMVLSPVGWVLKVLSGKKVYAMSHGRDTYYNNKIYQAIIPAFAKKLDGIFCVSNHLRNTLISRGLDPNKLFVLNNGINLDDYSVCNHKTDNIKFVQEKYGVDLLEKKVLLSVTRFVKRKGIGHFVENILPRIISENADVVLMLAGDETDKETRKEKSYIKNVVKELDLSEKVFFLGNISQKDVLNKVYSASDIFIMPNIVVKGDNEGFGIAPLEASMNELPVVAFDVGGIRDAVEIGKNGFLIREEDNKAFADKIVELLSNDTSLSDISREAKDFVSKKYSWENVAEKYLSIIGKP